MDPFDFQSFVLTSRHNPSPYSQSLPRFARHHLGKESMGEDPCHQLRVSVESKTTPMLTQVTGQQQNVESPSTMWICSWKQNGANVCSFLEATVSRLHKLSSNEKSTKSCKTFGYDVLLPLPSFSERLWLSIYSVQYSQKTWNLASSINRKMRCLFISIESYI